MPGREPAQHQSNDPCDDTQQHPVDRTQVVVRVPPLRRGGVGEEFVVDMNAGDGKGEDTEDGGVNQEKEKGFVIVEAKAVG